VLSRFTRTVFDSDHFIGGWAGQHMADMIGSEKVDAVNMDHVPGTDHVGGWLHRLQHGHDLSAVAHMWWEHGFGGGAQALYHVYGRDFFTPHGIPILPAETDRAYDLLTNGFHLSGDGPHERRVTSSAYPGRI